MDWNKKIADWNRKIAEFALTFVVILLIAIAMDVNINWGTLLPILGATAGVYFGFKSGLRKPPKEEGTVTKWLRRIATGAALGLILFIIIIFLLRAIL